MAAVRPPKGSLGGVLLAVGIAVAAIGAVAAITVVRGRLEQMTETDRATLPTVAEPQAPTSQTPELLEVTSDRLHRDYAGNEIAADQRYRGRPLRVTGAVQVIRYTLGDPHMKLWTTNEFESVDAWFDPAWVNDLAKINAGDHVTLRCVGGGVILMRPQLRRCWPESR